MKRTRLYIGLKEQDMKTNVDKQKVEDVIKERVRGGTFLEAKGLWNHKFEDSIVFECLDLEENILTGQNVDQLVEELAGIFKQESILKTVEEVEAEFVTPRKEEAVA